MAYEVLFRAGKKDSEKKTKHGKEVDPNFNNRGTTAIESKSIDQAESLDKNATRTGPKTLQPDHPPHSGGQCTIPHNDGQAAPIARKKKSLP
ncbi:MAG TPA: hypothetical protein VNQ76_19870 [Planctomicrobium sp.]|nr:hypothetical protein [Planctomicrobium sp.]